MQALPTKAFVTSLVSNSLGLVTPFTGGQLTLGNNSHFTHSDHVRDTDLRPRKIFLLHFLRAGRMTQPTFNRLIELEDVVLAPALSPKEICSSMELNHDTVLSRPILSNRCSVTIVTITDAYFCPFSCFLKSQRYNKENPMLKAIESFL